MFLSGITRQPWNTWTSWVNKKPTWNENVFSIESCHFRPPGPPPDISYYSQQLAAQNEGSDKGPSFVPEQFQYMQAASGPVGPRGPQGPLGSPGPQGFQG